MTSNAKESATSLQNEPKIKREDIILPRIKFSEIAVSQLALMLENDFTLSGKYLRILISGKGCDGFTYSVGFTDRDDQDFLVKIENDVNLEVLVDPFAAFYLGETTVHYEQDFESNREGFVVTNRDQKKYHGKFWRSDKTLVPPMINQ